MSMAIRLCLETSRNVQKHRSSCRNLCEAKATCQPGCGRLGWALPGDMGTHFPSCVPGSRVACCLRFSPQLHPLPESLSLSVPLPQKIKSDLRTGNDGWKCQLLMDLYANLHHHKVLPYFLLFFSFKVMSNSFSTSWTVAHQLPLSTGFFPGKNTGVGCHFLLQGVFLNQELNPSLLHWQADSLPLSHREGLYHISTMSNFTVFANT